MHEKKKNDQVLSTTRVLFFMLKQFLNKLLFTKNNHAQPKGEKKGHALENYPTPTPLPLQKKNNDQSLVSTWKERWRTSLHAVVESNPYVSLDQPSNQVVFRCTGYCHKSGILLYARFSCPIPSHSLTHIQVAIIVHTCPTREIWERETWSQ